MKFAIIAAGEGSRLAQESVPMPKPLVTIQGETLIDRLVRIFEDNGAEEIFVATRQNITINSSGTVPVRQIVCHTPSSMHTFHLLSKYLSDDPFILTTVDTIFQEDEFKHYVHAFTKSLKEGSDGMMGVTSFIDDEKPLYIKGTDTIEDFLDNDDNNVCRYISGGIYGLTPAVIAVLDECINNGQSRMRNFQRALVSHGFTLRTFPFSKIIDIDHASDIIKAQHLLYGRVLGIYRGKYFSPNSIDKDRMIMDSVLAHLSDEGYVTSTITEEELLTSKHLPAARLYLSMARSTEALRILKGHNVINSPIATLVCNDRRQLALIMKKLAIPHATPLTSPDEQDFTHGIWIKKALGSTASPSDTVFCHTRQEYNSAVEDFKHRDIEFVIEQHQVGDIIKFYGISPTRHFFMIYPSLDSTTKFGLETINGIPHHYSFDQKLFQNQIFQLADSINMNFFGGDAIIHPDGSFCIIDFNDWPSFSYVREEAATAISQAIPTQVTNQKNMDYNTSK